MRNNWWLCKGAFSKEWCDDVISVGKDKPLTQAGIFTKDNTSTRETQVSWVDDPFVVEPAWQAIWAANKDFFEFHIMHMPSMQFGIYSTGCYYNWHHDVDFTSDKQEDRKLSICIQLSDSSEYEGGDFQFLEYETPDYTEKGDVLIFPSIHTHRVHEITSGTRYSLVGWAEGPRWR